MKLTLYLFLLLLFSFTVFGGSGCFLYSESAYYCKDVSETLAKEECDLQGCDVRLFFKSTACASLPLTESCSDVFCKSTCSTIPGRECKAGAVPFGQESVWCSKGCCSYNYGDTSGGTSGGTKACSGSFSRYSCEQMAASAGVSSYSFLATDTSCTLMCNRGLEGAVKGETHINSSSVEVSAVSKDLGKGPTSSSPSTSSSSGSGIGGSLMILVVVLLILTLGVVVMVVVRGRKQISWGQSSMRVVPGVDGVDSSLSKDTSTNSETVQGHEVPVSSVFIPNNVPLHSSSHHHSKKASTASRLHAFGDFPSSSHKPVPTSSFSKLALITSKKRTALEKLELFTKLGGASTRINSKSEAVKNAIPKSAVNTKKIYESSEKKGTKSSLDELRVMSLKKK